MNDTFGPVVGTIIESNEISKEFGGGDYPFIVELGDRSKAYVLDVGDEIDLRKTHPEIEIAPLPFSILDRGFPGKKVEVTYSELNGKKL